VGAVLPISRSKHPQSGGDGGSANEESSSTVTSYGGYLAAKDAGREQDIKFFGVDSP
jgi:hypothetical protein